MYKTIPDMTIKQLNKQHPEKYVMTDGLFYIGVLDSRLKHTITTNPDEAVRWTYADSLHAGKLEFAILETKLSKLQYVRI